MAFGDVVRSRASPWIEATGIGGDSSTIWHCDNASDDLCELKTSDLTVSRSGTTPGEWPRGMGGDSSTIWHGDSSGSPCTVYELETSDFSVSRSGAAPSSYGRGIGGDSSEIWYCDEDDEKVYELETSDFSVSRSATSPSDRPRGIGGDSSEIWHCDGRTDDVYELKTSDLSVSRSAAAPGGPTGIGGDSSTIWHCDSGADEVYELFVYLAAPTSVQATDGVHTDKVVITWVKSAGATSYQVYRDGIPRGWLGDVATYNDTGAGAPSITPGAAVASDGESPDHVSLSLAGESTSNGAIHTYKVRAKNAGGESGDSGTNTGYRGVGGLTYQWQRSSGDADEDYSSIDGATTESYNDTEAPADGSGRFYQCVLDATGAAQQTSSSDRGYRISAAKPHTFKLHHGPGHRMEFHPDLKLG